MDIISIRKRVVDTDVVNDVTCTLQVSLHVWSYDFYDMTLSTPCDKTVSVDLFLSRICMINRS